MARKSKERPVRSLARGEHTTNEDDRPPKHRRTSRGAVEENAAVPTFDRASFKSAWNNLHRAGWFSKKPPGRGLSDLYRYVQPGCDANGEAGVDYFLGEAALLEYYNRTYETKETLASFEARVGVPRNELSGDIGRDSHDAIGEYAYAGRGDSGDGNDRELRNDHLEDVRCGTSEEASGQGLASVDCEKPTSVERALEDNVVAPSIPRDCLEITSPNSGPLNSIVCAVCCTECTIDRSCTECGKYIHHFCSHDVCLSLNLRDADGETMADFGDSSYCSPRCYTRATTSTADRVDLEVETTAPNTYGTPSNFGVISIPREEDTRRLHPSLVTPGERCAVAARNQPARIHGTGAKMPTSKRIARGKTSKSAKQPQQKRKEKRKETGKPKKKTAAQTLKEELLRRLHEAAVKYVDASIAFCPVDEEWMSSSQYRDVGSAYLTGVVTRFEDGKEKNADGVLVPTTLFEVHWTSTAFQTKEHVHLLSESDLVRGIKQFVRMQKHKLSCGESWQSLCNMVPQLSNVPVLSEDFEEIDEPAYRDWAAFRSRKELQIPLSPGEAEQIQSMTFSQTESLGQPVGLFTHADGTTGTKLREESRPYFGHSATSSFFAFVPLSFWNQVVVFSNEYADRSGNPSPKAISLDELMIFLGILWYMTLFDKGEMRNYWTDSEEATIFPGARSTSLGSIMTWRRFLYIRQNLCFRSNVTTADIQRDPAARIRPLISIVKSRCSTHAVVGRNVAVDEASVACRSRYARHIIVFNPRKPTGKYHFKFYMCCCSTTWYVVNFKLHCSSELSDRLDGVSPADEIAAIARLTAESSEIRSHVIEVTAPLKGSCRIVNTDNFYTSCSLLESLRAIGLYGRGTVRSSSRHFPHFTMILKGDSKPRGFMKQGVCLDKHIVAASWVDGSIVNIVSNADASGTTTVYRRIRNAREPFAAPICVGEYNSAMQGVDRHDQLRGRFSLCGGHSFQKWHKKLALSLLDIARCNAFICDELARGNNLERSGAEDPQRLSSETLPGRDRHRAFVVGLVRELFSGEWKKWIETENGMLYASSPTPAATSTEHDTTSNTETTLPGPPSVMCVANESWLALKGKSRTMRECTVCKFECRKPTQKTDFCQTHHVALCKRAYPVDHSKSHLCQEASWTCWQKYHCYYMPNMLYSADGNLRRSSPIYKAQAPFLKERRDAKKTHAQLPSADVTSAA